MDITYLPGFIFSANGGRITSRLLLFQTLCCLLAEETRAGRDPSVKIMTKLVEYPPVRGLHGLNKLLDIVKNTVFAYQMVKEDGDKNLKHDDQSRLSAAGDSVTDQALAAHIGTSNFKKNFSKFMDRKSLSANRKLLLDLKGECQDHMFTLGNLNLAIKALQDIVRKRREAYSNMTEAVGEFKACTVVDNELYRVGPSGLAAHQKCVKFKTQFQRLEAQYRKAYKNLEPLFETERKLREDKIYKLEEELRSSVVSEIKARLADGIRNLKEMAISTSLPEELLDEIESIDCASAARTLYNDICWKYCHPVIDEPYYRMTTVQSTFEDPGFFIMQKDERRFCAFGSTSCLLNGDVYGKRYEEVYVWANSNLDDKNMVTQLKLKTGTKIKQKLCSVDGKLAFGWTRKYACGSKKYGFYPVSCTDLVP